MNLRIPTAILIFSASAMAIVISFKAIALGIAIDTKELIDRAELIVTGEVVCKTGRKMELTDFNHDGSQNTFSAILTEYQIKISRIRKGNHERDIISVFGLGGSTEEDSEIWSNGFNYSVGDSVLLFISLNKTNNIWMPVGQSKGAFKLTEIDGLLRVEGMNEDAMVVKGGIESGIEHRIRQLSELEQYINRSE